MKEYIFGVIYTIVLTFVFFFFFYKDSINIIFIFTIPLLLFFPIIILRVKRKKLIYTNSLIILGFIIGFIISAIIKDNTLWPIAMIVWLAISTPSILLLNFIRNKK